MARLLIVSVALFVCFLGPSFANVVRPKYDTSDAGWADYKRIHKKTYNPTEDQLR